MKHYLTALATIGLLATSACNNSTAPATTATAPASTSTLTTAPTTATPLATTVTQDQATVEAALDTGCGAVSTASALAQPLAGVPEVGVVLGFAGGSCVAGKATAALIDKALADPSTVAWLNALPGQINTAIADAKKILG